MLKGSVVRIAKWTTDRRAPVPRRWAGTTRAPVSVARQTQRLGFDRAEGALGLLTIFEPDRAR
jgi:hypothetical protein